MDHPELAFRLRALPAAVFVDLIRQAGEPLTARTLKQRLAERGVAQDVVDAAWRRAQPGVKRHANIRAEPSGHYAWSDVPVPREVPRLTALAALERILRGRLAAPVKADLAEQVRRAVTERDVLEQQAQATYAGAREARTALERQIRVEAARALAEVAAEVEELAVGGASTDVLTERVRALVKAFDLNPIGRAGDDDLFDPGRHAPIGGHPVDGAPIMVIRPGYTWRVGDRDVLLEKAQVASVSGGR